MSCFIKLASLAVVSGTSDFRVELRLRTEPNMSPYFIPVELTTDEYLIETVAGLQFRPSYATPHARYVRRSIRVHNLTINELDGDRSITIRTDRGLFVPVPDDSEAWQSTTVFLPALFNSDFGYEVQSYMLVPSSRHEGQLVIDPNNPADYVFNGTLSYTRRANGVGLQLNDVFVGFQFPDQQSSVGRPFVVQLQFNDPIHRLPEDLTSRILGQITQRGYMVGTESPPVFRFLSESAIDELPSLVLSIPTDHDNAFQLVLSPHDYLVATPGDSTLFRLNILGHQEQHVIVGHSLLTKMVLHFDAVNRRIGFGEPLVFIN